MKYGKHYALYIIIGMIILSSFSVLGQDAVDLTDNNNNAGSIFNNFIKNAKNSEEESSDDAKQVVSQKDEDELEEPETIPDDEKSEPSSSTPTKTSSTTTKKQTTFTTQALKIMKRIQELLAYYRENNDPILVETLNISQLEITAPTYVYENTNFSVIVWCNGSRVEGANVMFDNITMVTDFFGQVNFMAPEVNSSTWFTITAEKEGYQGAERLIRVDGTELYLYFTSPVNEREEFEVIVFCNEIPVENANVSFNNETLQTDSNGSVTFTAPEVNQTTDFVIEAEKPGFQTVNTIITVLNVETPAIIFHLDYTQRTITVVAVDPNVLWSDIDINGSCNTSGLGTNVTAGDTITDCLGQITLIYIPTQEVLLECTFEQTTPGINFSANYIQRTITVIDTDALGYRWDDIDINGSCNTSGLREIILPGDTIHDCYGTIILTYIPSQVILEEFIFDSEPPMIVYVDDDFNKNTTGWGFDHFDNIQDGINAVAENGTVYVFNGIYYEHVVVNKTIDLIGEDRNSTFIDNSGSEEVDIVKIIADWVTVGGFTVDDNGSYEDVIGFHVCSNYSTIMNCNVFNSKYGIILPFVHNNSVVDNVIFNNGIGVFVKDSLYNIISNNAITFNTEKGVVLTCFNEHNTIIGNNISYNYHGIELIDFSSYDIIVGNTIYSNTQTGIYLLDGFNNTIYHNNIIDNAQNAVDRSDYWDHNFWDNGFPSGGNYWSDYNGTDNNNDGIGDDSYIIMGDNSTDRYPFIKQNGWLDVSPTHSSLILTNLNMAGLTTGPSGNGPAYKYAVVIAKDFMGNPIPGISADDFDFSVAPDNNTSYYENLSCSFIPVENVTNSNGSISFNVIGDTSIVGDIFVRVTIHEILLYDIKILPCISPDYYTDGDVDIVDFVLFAQDYNGPYNPRSDFDWDGNIDLGDLVLFAKMFNS